MIASEFQRNMAAAIREEGNKMSLIATLKNGYGNIDVRGSLPAGLAHVGGKRLQPTCRALGIEFAEAFIGFGGTKRFPKALTNGVVVADADAATLIAAIEKKKAKDTPEARAKRAIARNRRYDRERRNFELQIRERYPNMPDGEESDIALHACQVGSGRVGRSTVAEDPVKAAVIAHIRHNYTDYDELLKEEYTDRDSARREIREKVDEVLEEWSAGGGIKKPS